MKIIVCKINMGSLLHKVYIGDEEKTPIETKSYSMPIEEIPTFIVSYKDIFEVYLSGASEEFLKTIETDTKELEQRLFSKNTKNFHYV